MPNLTLRTLLAYMDDTLDPTEARSLGKKVAESEEAQVLVERIKKVTRRRGLATPAPTDHEATADPNTVAEYLDNALDSTTLKQVEKTCLESDVHLAEVAACHQILTLVLTEPVRVPPRAHRRMYGLVPAPASVPNRRPNKTLPIGGAAPPADARAEPDDADAALLLGMKRYSAATTWAARFALFGAAAILLMLLAGAALLSLPGQPTEPPKSTSGNSYALRGASGAEQPEPKKDKEPKGGAVVPPPKPVEPAGGLAKSIASAESGATKPVEPIAKAPDPKEKDKGVAPTFPQPSERRVSVGKVVTPHALVVSYRLDDRERPEDGGSWGRILPNEEIFSTEPTMALPGYKANVTLGDRNKQVEVLLWGNVPEQLPYRVFESRVKFHAPPEGFDAELSLQGGRIYLKAKKFDADMKAVPAKVRVRLGEEVWDLTLPDEQANVLVELVSWFEPGTTYAPKGGSRPKLEGRVGVIFGTVDFAAPKRSVKYEKVVAGTEITWNTRSGELQKPRPIENRQEAADVPTVVGEPQKILSKTLAEMADAVADPNNVRAVISGKLQPGDVPNRDLISRLAIFSWVALADSTAAGSATLKDVLDILNSELQWLGRQAVVTALVQWVARDVGNTALLRAQLSKEGSGIPAAQVDAVLEMLRGYISPTQPDPARLDTLVERLDGYKTGEFDKPEPSIPLRDIALWNLVVAELQVWIPPPIGVNVGVVKKFDDPEYKKFVTGWKARVEAIKKGPPPMPPKK